MNTQHDVRTYKTTPQGDLTLHVFREDPKPDKPQPAIVFFFGGGWRGGNPSQFFPHCEHLAARGITAISAEYRVLSRHETTPFECVKDGKSAVRWIRSNAGDLGIDPDRLAAGGGSAGGHVAACTGIVPNMEDDGEARTVSSIPNALVLFNPVIDTGPEGFGTDRVGPQGVAISPLHHVQSGQPPTLIFHGTADTTVPIEKIYAFRDKMVAAGNRCEVVAFEDMAHAFFNHGKHDNVPYEKTIRAMDRFLDEVFG